MGFVNQTITGGAPPNMVYRGHNSWGLVKVPLEHHPTKREYGYDLQQIRLKVMFKSSKWNIYQQQPKMRVHRFYSTEMDGTENGGCPKKAISI